MDRFVQRHSDNVQPKTNAADKLHEAITKSNVVQESRLAIAYVTQLVADNPEMLQPLALSSRVLSGTDIHRMLQEQRSKGNSQPIVYFADTLGMLSLRPNEGAFVDLGSSKIRFACERLQCCPHIGKVWIK